MAVSEPIEAPVRLSYQEILRSIGAWIDVRGYDKVRIAGDADGLTIEGVLALEETGGAPERLVLDNDQLQRFCDASRLNRSPLPTVNPPSRRHLTIVPFDSLATDTDN